MNEREKSVRVLGPRDARVPHAINTTSHSTSDWSRGLSPFVLGPVSLYDGHSARLTENGWQFSKLYSVHADEKGEPTTAYWEWARTGWNSTRPHRYPMGKGARPLCSLWKGERLDYIAARQRIYLPLYRDAVRQTEAFRTLQSIYARDGHITLWEFDGFDHHRLNMTLAEVLLCPNRIMGHSFVLAMMLIYGEDFTPAQVCAAAAPSK